MTVADAFNPGYFVTGSDFAVVCWSSSKERTSTDYYLAGREISRFVVGCSLLASNIGSKHIVGLAWQRSIERHDYGPLGLHAWIILMLGRVFVPFQYRFGVFARLEFLERRF